MQCIRQGQDEPIDRTADLYLLLEPRQLVLFDLDRILNRLIWQGAAVTRLRLTDRSGSSYFERIVVDDDGFVERVERRYSSPPGGSHRVFLTCRPRLAQMWRDATCPREAWNTIRRSVAWSRIDRMRTPGRWFLDQAPAQERVLLDELVDSWRDPDRVIDGIEQSHSGVWRRKATSVPASAVFVGPLWLGNGHTWKNNECIIGPTWVEDAPGAEVNPARVRDMFDVELVESRRAPTRSRFKSLYPVAKRLFDIGFSAAILLLLSPLLLLIAAAIVIDSGFPVLFGHTRQSRGGKLFKCLKFRTMHQNAEQMVPNLKDRNLCDGPQVFIKNDPRVTRVGHVLRRFQLDELPQFWNVLRGDMSIVGPRPSPDRENQFCPAWRELRLSVRPGITGLWQLQRTRSPGEDFQEWIRYDIEYVRQANFWFDLSICLRTVGLMIFRRRTNVAE